MKLKAICVAILCFATTCSVFATATHHRRQVCYNKHHARVKCASSSWKKHGQQVIAQDRVREIQTALIREHYLSGSPSGTWDQQTKNAMMKYQADQGWQTKRLPDARALIKLGLGPSHETVKNDSSTAVLGPNLDRMPQE